MKAPATIIGPGSYRLAFYEKGAARRERVGAGTGMPGLAGLLTNICNRHAEPVGLEPFGPEVRVALAAYW